MIDFSPAKINIGLHITQKRPDNFHNLESFFYPIGWRDVVEILPNSNKTQLTIFGNAIQGNPEENLCMKAYRLLKRDYQLPHVHIVLQKNIPIGAGLGGGSSNAVAVLKILNTLFKLQIKDKQLCDYALKLGSDTAFFVDPKPTIVKGRGDILQPINLSLDKYHIVVIFPKVHVSTAEAYRNIKVKQRTETIENLLQLCTSKWQTHLSNDFEAYVFHKYPIVENLKSRMISEGAFYASMSGSGSAVFGLFEEQPNLDFIHSLSLPFYYNKTVDL